MAKFRVKWKFLHSHTSPVKGFSKVPKLPIEVQPGRANSETLVFSCFHFLAEIIFSYIFCRSHLTISTDVSPAFSVLDSSVFTINDKAEALGRGQMGQGNAPIKPY